MGNCEATKRKEIEESVLDLAFSFGEDKKRFITLQTCRRVQHGHRGTLNVVLFTASVVGLKMVRSKDVPAVLEAQPRRDASYTLFSRLRSGAT